MSGHRNPNYDRLPAFTKPGRDWREGHADRKLALGVRDYRIARTAGAGATS